MEVYLSAKRKDEMKVIVGDLRDANDDVIWNE